MVIDKYDCIVVGAGNGGLSAAAYFAKNGKKVLVLEKHNLPGGCSTSFVRGRFEFEATLHEMCQVGEGENAGAVRKLLDDEYGLKLNWVPIHEAFRSISTDPNNKYDITLPDGVEAFIAGLEREVPGSSESMRTVMELARMITDGVDFLAGYHNEPEGLAKVKLLLKYGDLMKTVPISCDEMLRRIGVPDKARQIYESYWDYVCADSTHMSFAVYAFMTYTYLKKKPWIVKDRSHELAMAFDDVIRRNGGDIWYNTEVEKIDIKNNQVEGVILTDGTYIKCHWVMSNLMPEVVFRKMVDPKEVPTRDKKAMNARKIGSTCVTVYLALDIPYEELGFKAYDTFLRSTGDNHVQYETSKKIISHNENCVTIINEVIPDCTPEGTCFVQFARFFADDAWTEDVVTDENYFEFKEKFADETIKQFEDYIGKSLRDHIEEVVVATPVTWARYLGTPYGDVYGYEPRDWDGMFPRVQSGHHEDYTVKGLRFCGGHGTQMDGYSQAYLSGKEQARYMILDMEKQAKKESK